MMLLAAPTGSTAADLANYAQRQHGMSVMFWVVLVALVVAMLAAVVVREARRP